MREKAISLPSSSLNANVVAGGKIAIKSQKPNTQFTAKSQQTAHQTQKGPTENVGSGPLATQKETETRVIVSHTNIRKT